MTNDMTTRFPAGRLLVATALAAVTAGLGGAAPASAAPVHCYGLEANVVGTSASETINASDGVTDGRNVINGLGGNDLIYGLGGDDVICGGDGADSILGGTGNDKIAGNTGGDAIWGEAGADQMEGFGGDDRILGGSGADRLDGGDGNAANFGLDWGDDTLYGETGNDLIRGAAGEDWLDGGNNTLDDGANGTDTIYGYGGHDILRDISGSGDYLIGGDGPDHLYSRDNPPYALGDLVHGGNGTDICSADTNDNRQLCES